MAHIRHKGMAFQLLLPLKFPNRPIQHTNKSTTHRGISQYSPSKHRTKVHYSLVSSILSMQQNMINTLFAQLAQEAPINHNNPMPLKIIWSKSLPQHCSLCKRSNFDLPNRLPRENTAPIRELPINRVDLK